MCLRRGRAGLFGALLAQHPNDRRPGFINQKPRVDLIITSRFTLVKLSPKQFLLPRAQAGFWWWSPEQSFWDCSGLGKPKFC